MQKESVKQQVRLIEICHLDSMVHLLNKNNISSLITAITFTNIAKNRAVEKHFRKNIKATERLSYKFKKGKCYGTKRKPI
jgi:ssRNA-specific RNase YbeY (16S rRNA maturation enzyme)